ncbi:MAG: precorrin-2 C(20)-methyltransferase [Lachnospiraceae bacterium]|jgi:precorrin-2/cobalt-factor-2 C20-methyltransferase|nr:precorrin-2 C(20)-methyltransferase [Lachnospiraceae bacterium]
MAGKLYGIGVGPGDPELLTLKAVRVIRECGVILVPGEDYRQSVAYRIARQAVPELDGKLVAGVPVPMTRDQAERDAAHRQTAAYVMDLLDRGEQVGFLNLGDVTVYASCLYIHRLVAKQGYETELVSGVPSFCAAAARLGTGLAEDGQQLHILPQPEQIREGLKLPGTKVIMKMGRNMGQVKQWLKESGHQVHMVERCGMPGERLYGSADAIREDASYYSLLIVRENGESSQDMPEPV